MKAAQKGLGRGFDSLIPQNFDSSLLLADNERVQKLFTMDILPNPQQPRQAMDKQALEELAGSIKQHGLLQPIIVTPIAGGKYELVAGERRWRAASQAGLKSLPAIVRTTKQLEQLEIALIENVQRVDLNPMEQAVSIQRLHDQFNIEYGTIAKRLGKAISTITNLSRLTQLPPAAQEALRDGRIVEGHARQIVSLKDNPDKQAELLDLIQKNNWTVRQAERFVTAFKAGHKDTASLHQRAQASTPATEKLSRLLRRPVKIWRTANGGRLELGFKTEEELEKLIAKLLKLFKQ